MEGNWKVLIYILQDIKCSLRKYYWQWTISLDLRGGKNRTMAVSYHLIK